MKEKTKTVDRKRRKRLEGNTNSFFAPAVASLEGNNSKLLRSRCRSARREEKKDEKNNPKNTTTHQALCLSAICRIRG